MQIVVRTFEADAATDAEWAAYQAYRRLRTEEDTPGEPVLSDADFERNLRHEWPFARYTRVLAWVGAEVVGNMLLEYRREGTPDFERHAAFVGVSGGVAQAWRRQGVARSLLLPLADFMSAEHRKIATFARITAPESQAFMHSIGATEKHRAIENRMAFDGLDHDELARWEADATARHPALKWECHAGRVPHARLALFMPALTAMLNAQPLGELDMAPMRYELDGYASWYADMDRRGGDHFMVLLMDGDEVAAACDANWDERFPQRLHQQLTGVAPAWRGKGLAKAVKAGMLRLVRERRPEVTTAITINANTNTPMLSINQRLGFAMHRQDSFYQLGVEALGEFINASRMAPTSTRPR